MVGAVACSKPLSGLTDDRARGAVAPIQAGPAIILTMVPSPADQSGKRRGRQLRRPVTLAVAAGGDRSTLARKVGLDCARLLSQSQ
jgi:hypothetical protein